MTDTRSGTPGHEVDVVDVPSQTVAVSRFHVGFAEMNEMSERIGVAFDRVAGALGTALVDPDGPAVAIYDVAQDGFDVAAGFRVPRGTQDVAGVECLDLEGTRAAHTTHIGPYAGLAAAWEDLQTEAARTQIPVQRSGLMWEEYWSPPDTPTEDIRTDVYWAVDPGPASKDSSS